MRLEQWVRSELKERLGAAHTSPDAWSSISGRVEQSERRARWVQLVAACLTVGLFATAFFFVTQAFKDKEGPVSTTGDVSDSVPRITSTIPLPREGTKLAADEGIVWVATDRRDSGSEDTLLRVDAATNEVAAEIPVNGLIGSLAAGEEGVWVSVFRVGTGNVLMRIDPQTNSVESTVEGVGGFVAVGGGRVWVLGSGETASGSTLTSIDPATARIDATLEIPNGAPSGIKATEDAVWILAAETGDSGGTGAHVVLVDPSPLMIVKDFGSIAVPQAMAAYGDSVWVQGWLSTFDPHTSTGSDDRIVPVLVDGTTVTVEHGAPMSVNAVFRPFTAMQNAAWFLGRSSSGSFISSIEAASMAVGARLPLETSAVDMAYDRSTNTIWVLNLEQSLTEISSE